MAFTETWEVRLTDRDDGRAVLSAARNKRQWLTGKQIPAYVTDYMLGKQLRNGEIVLDLPEEWGQSVSDLVRNTPEIKWRNKHNVWFAKIDIEPKRVMRKPDSKKPVDLKWSLWSKERDYWDDYAPGVWDEIANLPVGHTIEISTAPRKEIRFGHVQITRESARKWIAWGKFKTEWDDLESLAEDLGVEVEHSYDREAFSEVLPYTESGIGVEVGFEVTASSPSALMSKIDKQEEILLEQDQKAWSDVKGVYPEQ
jgi:hypothetical protein